MIVKLDDVALIPLASLAVMATVNVPVAVGVPEMIPVPDAMERPLANPVAVKTKGPTPPVTVGAVVAKPVALTLVLTLAGAVTAGATAMLVVVERAGDVEAL